VARDLHRPGREPEEARDDPERGALARSVRPQEADDLPPVDLEREVVDRDLRAVALDEVLDGDHLVPTTLPDEPGTPPRLPSTSKAPSRPFAQPIIPAQRAHACGRST